MIIFPRNNGSGHITEHYTWHVTCVVSFNCIYLINFGQSRGRRMVPGAGEGWRWLNKYLMSSNNVTSRDTSHRVMKSPLPNCYLLSLAMLKLTATFLEVASVWAGPGRVTRAEKLCGGLKNVCSNCFHLVYFVLSSSSSWPQLLVSGCSFLGTVPGRRHVTNMHAPASQQSSSHIRCWGFRTI